MRVQVIESSCLAPPSAAVVRKPPLVLTKSVQATVAAGSTRTNGNWNAFQMSKSIGKALFKIVKALKYDVARSAEIHNRMMSHYDDRYSHSHYYIR